MRIVIGSDHAGFALKNKMSDVVRALGHDVLDIGAFNENPSDYPDFAELVGRAVAEGRSHRGVLVCGSGVGVSVAANKIPGIRAAVCHDTYSAHQGVEHDDMNVLVLGSRIAGEKLAEDLVKSFWAPNSRTKRAMCAASTKSKRSNPACVRRLRKPNAESAITIGASMIFGVTPCSCCSACPAPVCRGHNLAWLLRRPS